VSLSIYLGYDGLNMGTMRRNSDGYSSVATVFNDKVKKDKISYCQKCLEFNVLSALKHRIYLDEKGKINPNPPPDSKNWKQCWTCGDIVGIYEAKQEADIFTLTEPRDNPFRFGDKQNNIQTGESRNRKFDRTCKTQRKKQFKHDLEQYKEEDIKEALRKGAKLVSFTEY
jgi:hypothetical protein